MTPIPAATKMETMQMHSLRDHQTENSKIKVPELTAGGSIEPSIP